MNEIERKIAKLQLLVDAELQDVGDDEPDYELLGFYYERMAYWCRARNVELERKRR